MDPGPLSDTLMHDGDGEIVTSTEFTQVTTAPSSFGSITGLPAANGTLLGAKSITPALKGTGLKRDDVFDHDLTQLKDAPRPPKFDALPYATAQTGLIYDVRMRFHVEAIPTEEDVHPEDPRRIHAIFEAFVQAGLAWREGTSGPLTDYYMGRIDARMVTMEEVLLVHTKAHWDWVQTLSTKNADQLVDYLQHPLQQSRMDSVYLSPSTPYCAALSAGGAIEACRATLLGKVKNVFAIIRPPGHHAEREDAKGFCFYDNVSIATKACQREFGPACRKVLILDWDVHHGNGIQQANYDDPNVLYISLHVHESGRFYPELSYRDKRVAYGDHLHCGEGAGIGKNVNIPWSRKGMGDADYIYAFQQVVMPIATEFNPDLVIIAAGFDAAEGDMLGGCKVTPAGYAHMTHMLMSLAGGKLAVCLEGGYNLDSIARSATAVSRTLMGQPPDRLEQTNPSITGVSDIKEVVRQQSKFWTSLYPKNPSTKLAGPMQGERMHDVIRRLQAERLWDEHQMSPLHVYRESLSNSFENQVMATPNYMDERPLLVILHDPPGMESSPDPRTGKTELHNTWLTDSVKHYISEAIKKGFAVIDVNLPKHITDEDDEHNHEETDLIAKRSAEATDLLNYLWENYIELADSTHVFLLGTNVGHVAITNWIRAHEDTAMDRVDRTIHFIEDVSLQACRSQTNDMLSPWYYRTSLIWLANEHNFWSSDFAQKPKKKFGRVMRTDGDQISEMLVEQKDKVLAALFEDTKDWRSDRPATDDEDDVEEDIDAMDIAESNVVATSSSARRLPAVGNFALSPARRSSPAGPGSGTPKLLSPTRGGFASVGRSPAR